MTPPKKKKCSASTFLDFVLLIRPVLFLEFLIISLSAFSQEIIQDKTRQDDSESFGNFIQSKGYLNPIIFDKTNIKQYWIDNSVYSTKDAFFIDLSINKTPKKIQLININETFDCKIDIIAGTADFSFDVLDKNSKVISTSIHEKDLKGYSVITSSFHMENTTNFTFFLDFKSDSLNEVEIKNIVLSFSKNNNSIFLSSPGRININENKYSISSGISATNNNDKSITLNSTGSDIIYSSKNMFLLTDNIFKLFTKIKNIGNQPANVYVGFIPYTNQKVQISNRIIPYKNNREIFKVISAKKNSNKIIIDSLPENWKKGCYLALNANEDLSDFPNTNFIPGEITEINQTDNGQVEIVLANPLDNTLKEGTSLRIQSPYGARYLYTNNKTLQPGEEIDFTSIMKKDDEYYGYSSKAFCRGTYCVRPVIYIPYNSDKDCKIQIFDFTISY